MNINKTIAVSLIASAILGLYTNVYADSCQGYKYNHGIDVLDVEGGTKILSTGTASVSFDDVDSIKDARDEATMEAKALISKFLTEDILSDEKINSVIKERSATSGDSRTADRTQLTERVKSLRNSSRALLRGVVPLGDCYTNAREVRVTVGIKPETIKSAGNLSTGISNSVTSQSRASSASQPSVKAHGDANYENTPARNNNPLRGVEGYSNTERINSF